MNSTINTLLTHRSIREYADIPIADEALLNIIKCAQSGPNSINGQQFSVIVIRDPETKQVLSELCGKQEHVALAPVFLVFVADYHKAELASKKQDKSLEIVKDIEALLVSSVDIGISLGNAIAAAESMGIGAVPIGGIRKNPDQVVELLKLPPLVFPMVGLCLGYPSDPSSQKPRFSISAFMHFETYNPDLSALVDEYDEVVSEYMLERTDGKSDRNWSKTVSNVYKSIYYPKVTPTLKQQGFLKDDE